MPFLATQGAASARGFGLTTSLADRVFIEDVFSTYLWTSTGSNVVIDNGIDLSTKGGLVWEKCRSVGVGHTLTDTARGVNKTLETNFNGAESTGGAQTFSTNGFTTSANIASRTFVGWTFRKQAKFFDVVTYTGNGVAGRAISHSLGSTPGCVIVKATDLTQKWTVFHRSLGGTKALALNLTDASDTDISYWNNSNPTSTTFIVGGDGGSTNNNGTNYVAYLFAHDAGGFGTAGTDNVISCGSFTTDGSGNYDLELGYEPQWYLQKPTVAGAWWMTDTMRGFDNSPTKLLRPHLSDAEYSDTTVYFAPTATGLKVTNWNASTTYIYIAIRRGPMKTPTSGTSVYNAIARTGTGAAATVTGVGFAPDFVGAFKRGGGVFGSFFDKLRGAALLQTGSTNAESAAPNEITAYGMDGVSLGTSGGQINYDTFTYINWFFRRSPGFMDVVCYTGTGSATTFSHNLGVVPELMIVKRRDTTGAWDSYCSALANTEYIVLNTTAAKATGATRWNSTTPTSSVFSVGTSTTTNASAGTYVAYLFATVSGVSKVGSYTGTGTTQTINCGFTAGARFVLIKRTDSTGDWYVWDTTRGIIAGNDPYLLLNSTAAEVTNTDYIDTASSGFELSSTAPDAINADGGTFIFLAIA